MKPRSWVDGELEFSAISAQMLSELSRLAPFGPGNPKPLFYAARASVVDGPRRIKDRHLKMSFKHGGRVLRGIAWRAVEREAFVAEHRDGVDVAFSVEEDNWNGQRYTQLSVADFRAPTP